MGLAILQGALKDFLKDYEVRMAEVLRLLRFFKFFNLSIQGVPTRSLTSSSRYFLYSLLKD